MTGYLQKLATLVIDPIPDNRFISFASLYFPVFLLLGPFFPCPNEMRYEKWKLTNIGFIETFLKLFLSYPKIDL
jgi:hypothetical protein